MHEGFVCASLRRGISLANWVRRSMIPLERTSIRGRFSADGYPNRFDQPAPACPQEHREKRGHNFGIINSNFDSVKAKDYDTVFIPGREGTRVPAAQQERLRPRQGFKAKKLIGTLCHGPQLLAAAGGLEGRKLTACPALNPELKRAGEVGRAERDLLERLHKSESDEHTGIC